MTIHPLHKTVRKDFTDCKENVKSKVKCMKEIPKCSIKQAQIQS